MSYQARKSLGQHFLHQRQVIEAIVAHFDPDGDDVVVEIGPGRGALTFELCPRVNELHALEIDRELFDRLRAASGCTNLIVHNVDAVHFDYRQLANGRRLRVIGNLPYNVSTPLLFRLLAAGDAISDMLLMLQKEVVDRMRAAPGSKTYGRLSVMLQQRCRVDALLTVSRGAFQPPPKVESAVVRLLPFDRPPHPVTDHDRFATIVRTAFSQRRKTLRNALKGICPESLFGRAAIDPQLRPEQLSVADFVRLSETRD